MGARGAAIVRFVTDAERSPPEAGEPELTPIGPRYGESVVPHVGDSA